jgi:hypothetical protein
MVLHSVDHPTTNSLVPVFTVHERSGEPKNGATVLWPTSQHAESVKMGFWEAGVSITFVHSSPRLLTNLFDGSTGASADAGATWANIMPKTAATTIKARVTKRFIRPPRLNEMTPHSAAGARCSTVFLALETARYPTEEPGGAAKLRKTRQSACD